MGLASSPPGGEGAERHPARPMSFQVTQEPTRGGDPIAADLALLQHAGPPRARLWEGPVSLVVPRSYRRHAAFERVAAQFAARGCPVHERPSGGGLVPQGPGILNLSLVYTLPGGLGTWMERVYLHLCALLQGTLLGFGVPTHWQAVGGSFCDGRFNLACGRGDAARKIAGTAQYWRRLPASTAADAPGHAVLAHAVLLVEPDLQAAHTWANDFEQAIGSGRHYDPDRTTSVAHMLGSRAQSDLTQRLTQALACAVQQSVPPNLAA